MNRIPFTPQAGSSVISTAGSNLDAYRERSLTGVYALKGIRDDICHGYSDFCPLPFCLLSSFFWHTVTVKPCDTNNLHNHIIIDMIIP